MTKAEHITTAVYYKSLGPHHFRSFIVSLRAVLTIIGDRQSAVDFFWTRGRKTTTHRDLLSRSIDVIEDAGTKSIRGIQVWAEAGRGERDRSPHLGALLAKDAFDDLCNVPQAAACISVSNRYIHSMTIQQTEAFLLDAIVPLSNTKTMTSGVIDVSYKADTAYGLAYILEGSLRSLPWERRLDSLRWRSLSREQRASMIRRVSWGVICGSGIARTVTATDVERCMDEHGSNAERGLGPRLLRLPAGGYIATMSSHPKTIIRCYRDCSNSSSELQLSSHLSHLWRSKGVLC